MELRINAYEVTPEITFNFDELKTEIAERVSYYTDLVYTEGQMKEAKADRAKLRKVVEAIDSQRKQVKADLLKPYNDLEAKLDEIKAIIQEPINMIDYQIKEYEELQKKTKGESIQVTWENKGCPFDLMTIWNPKWLNTTYSMKKITEEMDDAIQKYHNGIETLSKMGEYSFEATERFRQTLDLGKALEYAQELKSMADLKKQYEERIEIPAEEQQILTDFMNPPEEPKSWVCFQAYVTAMQAKMLRDFFLSHDIEFKRGE